MRRLAILILFVSPLLVVACGGGGGGTKTYSLSGTVTLNGSGHPGVTVDLDGDATDSTTTDANGEYSFSGLKNGSYTVTPSLANQTLTPGSRNLDVSGSSVAGADFALDTYTLSGQVTLNSSGYQGCDVDLSGDATGTRCIPTSHCDIPWRITWPSVRCFGS